MPMFCRKLWPQKGKALAEITGVQKGTQRPRPQLAVLKDTELTTALEVGR